MIQVIYTGVGSGQVTDMVLLQDNQTIVATSYNLWAGYLLYFNLTTGAGISPNNSSPLTFDLFSIALLSNNRFAYCGNNPNIYIQNATIYSNILTLSGGLSGSYCYLAVLLNGYLASSDNQGHLSLWNTTSGSEFIFEY